MAHDTAGQSVEAIEGEPERTQPEGHHDIRHASAGAALIIGTLGALAVPALFVLFTVSKSSDPNRQQIVALAGGLLIVSLMASISGALALNAIGAQQHPTGNLVPATMYAGVASALALVTVLGAFEVLVAIYLPASTTLFAIITGVAGLGGCFSISLGIADVPHTGPMDPDKRRAWHATQWINSRKKADKHASIVGVVSAIPAIVGMALRIAGFHVATTSHTVTSIVGSALVIAVGGSIASQLRLRHPAEGPQKGLRLAEAYGTTLAVSSYTLVLMMLLPGAQS